MKNKLFALASFLLVFFIFITMNDFIAQLIFYWGLSIIGLIIFKLLHLIFDKIHSIIKNIRLVDCGFWNEEFRYQPDYKIVNIEKERIKNEES